MKRLTQFFEDAVTRSGGDISGPEVKLLIDQTVQPLTLTYVQHYAELELRPRSELIHLLSAYQDARSEPALKKAFDEFVRRPATTKDESDLKWAARAAAELKLPGLAMPLLAASGSMQTSNTLGGTSYKDVLEAMRVLANSAWVEPLIARLEPEMRPPGHGNDAPLIDAYRDQQFWQFSAAEMLGRIGDARAVVPLLHVLLDPAKPDVQATAMLALVKIGKPSVEAATRLLEGTDRDLIAFSEQRIQAVTGQRPLGAPYVTTAALVLGTIGRVEAAGPLIAACQREKDATTRAWLARELSKLPANAASKAEFRRVYETIKLDTEMDGGGSALEALTEAAGTFHDSDFVGWLLQRAARAGGNADDLQAYRATVIVTILKLARPGQLPEIKKAVDRYASELEKGLYEETAKLLQSCGDRVACYLAELQKPQNHEQATQWRGIKAGYMIGILGDDTARDQLVSVLDALNNAAVRYVAAQTIDHLTPRKNQAVTAKLDSIITKNAKSADREKAAYDAPVKQILYRINARDLP